MEPKVELLAPVGTYDVLETVIAAGADAVYLGGKRFNMRMHRKDFNFDDDAIKAAVTYAHDRNVRFYVTVNNLLADEEIEEVSKYITFLEKVGVDAIIIQDIVMLDLLKILDAKIEVHASVMMNTSNFDTVRYLKDRGVTRIVTSREMTLEQIKTYRQKIDMEFEYFIHGDMCYAQSGQCYYSGILFGQSSNRGKCVKPCRWPLRREGEDEFKHHLAVKDMCMFYNLRELIQSGVCCFKIEGRMRTAEYLAQVVRSYRREIDQYLDDQTGYLVDLRLGQELYTSRVRDFSTCFAFGRPGHDFIDSSGVREPRQFSQAIKEPEITEKSTIWLKERLKKSSAINVEKRKVKITVAVPTFKHFEKALEAGAERIYIGGETYRPLKPWSVEEIAKALKLGYMYGTEVAYRTPGIIMEKEMDDLKKFVDIFKEYHLRMLTGNIGVIEALYSADIEFTLYGDIGINAYNSGVFNYLKRQGFQSATISIEAGCKEIVAIGQRTGLEVEIIAQGAIRGMISDNCLKAKHGGICNAFCNTGFTLEDKAGCLHQIEVDQYCRNHVFMQNHLSLLPIMGELVDNGVSAFRVEGALYSPEEVFRLVQLYRRVIKFDYDAEIVNESFAKIQVLCKVPLTYGALISNQ